MKLLSVFGFAMVVLACTLTISANVLPQELIEDVEDALIDILFDQLPEEKLDLMAESNHRQKRATCDLTSGTAVQSSLCAAHCILLKYKGGYCDDKLVCVCRN